MIYKLKTIEDGDILITVVRAKNKCEARKLVEETGSTICIPLDPLGRSEVIAVEYPERNHHTCIQSK